MGTYQKLMEHTNIFINGNKEIDTEQCTDFIYYSIKQHYPDIMLSPSDIYFMLDLIGSSWVSKEGKLTKRIQKYFENYFNIKIPNNIMGIIGDGLTNFIISRDINIKITTEFDWYPGDFGDFNSCFWGSRSGAKHLIMKNGGGALKFFSNNYHKVGRCLFLPFNNDVVFFNFYGQSDEFLKGNLPFLMNILKQMFSKIYKNEKFYMKKVNLCNYGDSDALLYFNNDEGIIVSETLYEKNYVDFEIQYYCSYCKDTNFDEGRYEEAYDIFICDRCNDAVTCDNCGNLIYSDENCYVTFYEESVCQDCFDKNYSRCRECNNIFCKDDLTEVEDHDLVCDFCLKNYYKKCDNCKTYTSYFYYVSLNNKETLSLCYYCHLDYSECTTCYYWYPKDHDNCPNCSKEDNND